MASENAEDFDANDELNGNEGEVENPDDEAEAPEAKEVAEGAEKESGGKKSSRKKSTEPTPPRGLPMDVQRVLAQAIEAEGGIRWFTQFGCVKTLCDSRPDLFGETGSKRRVQVRNRICYWKKVDPAKYKQMLEKFARDDAGPQNATSRPLTTTIAQQNLSRQAMALQQAQAQALPQQQQQFAVGALPHFYQAAQLQQMTAASNLTNTTANCNPPQRAKRRKLSVDGDDYEAIHVDTKTPERNGEFEVFEVPDIEKDGFLHNAFEITKSGDLRDFLADSYSATLVGEREVLVTLPSVSYSFLHDHEEFAKQAKSGGFHCPSTDDAHETTRKRILRDPSRQKRRILLVFPDSVELTNKVFSPDSQDKQIDYDLNPITVTVKFGGKDLPMTITRISWKIAIVEKQQRRAEGAQDSKPQTKGEAKLARFFS